MKKMRTFKFFSIGCILAIALVLIGFQVLQAQMKIQAKGGNKGKPPKSPVVVCVDDLICEYEEYIYDLSHEDQLCLDCLPKTFTDALTITQDPGVQILSYWPGSGRMYQYKYEEGEYKATWASDTPLTSGGYPFIGEPYSDEDGDKKFLVIKNYLVDEVVTGKGKKNRIVTKYYEQDIAIFETGSFGNPIHVSSHFGYSEGRAHHFLMADANNDGLEDELILNKAIGDGSYSYIQIFRYNPGTNDFDKLWESIPYYSAGLQSSSVSDADGDGENEIVLRSFHGGYAIIIDHLGGDSWGNAKFSEPIPDCRLDKVIAVEADNGLTEDPEIIGGGNTGEIAVWKLIDGQYEMVFLSEYMGGTQEGYIGDIEVGDIDGDSRTEVIFSFYGYGSGGETIIYICELIPTGETYILDIESVNVLDRRGPAFAIGDLDGDGKVEIIHNGRGGTIYTWDSDSNSLKKEFYEIFLANPRVK